MKKLALILALALPSLALAEAPAAPDYLSIAGLLRQQRDTATQQAQDASLQVALLQKQLEASQAKVAALQKQIDDAKPKAKPDTAPAKK